MVKRAIDSFLVVLDFLLRLHKNHLGNLCFIPIKFSKIFT